MDNVNKIYKLFTNLCTAFGINKKLEKDRIILYAGLLMKEFNVEEIESGFIHLIKNRQNSFFPTLGNIREAIFSSLDNEESAKKYTEGIMKCLKKHGIYNSGNFEDPLFETAVVSSGGWKKLCQLPEEETKSLLIEKLKYLMEDKERIKNKYPKNTKLLIGGYSNFTKEKFSLLLEKSNHGLLLR